MRWYNRILRHVGNRRLFTRREYVEQFKSEFRDPRFPFVVMNRTQYGQLVEIAALANIINDSYKHRRWMDPFVYSRLEAVLTAYKHPPSAIKTHEERIFDMP